MLIKFCVLRKEHVHGFQWSDLMTWEDLNVFNNMEYVRLWQWLQTSAIAVNTFSLVYKSGNHGIHN